MAGFPVPYLLGRGGTATQELIPLTFPDSTVTGTLSVERPLDGTASGVATVTGALFTDAGTGFLSGTSVGTSTVTGNLQAAAKDGDGDVIVELAGTSDGVATVGDVNIEVDLARQQPRYLYLYINVGVGFDDYDTYSGSVSQTFPDGDQNPSYLGQYLYQYLNVGVGFDDYDTYTGDGDIVSQTFPDGHNRDDFARYLYQYLCVIKGRQGLGKLAILPSGVDKHAFVPRPEPPSNVNS